MLEISVIICAHNSRRDYLARALQALEAQTLPKSSWELLLVDNASEPRLACEIGIAWHPHARHVREDTLGLTFARVRGIEEARGDLVVFVDDDNVLNPDYLEIALEIGRSYHILGAWGGQVHAEFEIPPPPWLPPVVNRLAIREFDRDRWSNVMDCYVSIPCGAGMCVRREVAERYAQAVRSDSRRALLGRRGRALASYEDVDLAYTSYDLGQGTGQFTRLHLTHLIPAHRMTTEYLVRLAEGDGASRLIAESLRSPVLTIRPGWQRRILALCRFANSLERRLKFAERRGRAAARRLLLQSGGTLGPPAAP